MLEESGRGGARRVILLKLAVFEIFSMLVRKVVLLRDCDSLGCSVLRVDLDVSSTVLLTLIVVIRMMMLGSSMVIRGRLMGRFTVAGRASCCAPGLMMVSMLIN